MADHRIRMINAKGEISLAVLRAPSIFARCLSCGEFVGSQGMFRTEITRSNSITAPEQTWRFFRSQSWKNPAELRGLVRLAQCNPNITRQWVISRQPFIRSLQNNGVLFPTQRFQYRRFREWANHIDMDRTDFCIPGFPQIITSRLHIVGSAAE